MSATSTPAAPSKSPANTHNQTLPALQWYKGIVWEILIQPGEKLYAFSVLQADNSTATLRIADPHTGAPLCAVGAENLIYDTMKEAYFRNVQVEVGFRDFGPGSQAGIGGNLVIDRVSLTRTLPAG